MIVGPHAFGFITGFAGTTTSSYEDVILGDNPEVYFRLGESSGDEATDISGNDRNGVYQNGPALGVDGLIDGDDTAVEFDAVSEQYVSNTWKGILGTQPLTVEAWVQTSETSEMAIMAWGRNDSDGAKFTFTVDDGAPRVRVTGGNVSWSATLNDGSPHHVAVLKPDGGGLSDLTCYVDGEAVEFSDTGSQSIDLQEEIDFEIGREDIVFETGRYFDGVIDEVAVYARELTETEIQEHYDAGVGN